MGKFRLTIGRLILLGTLGVIVCFLIGNVIGVLNLNKSVDKVEYINDEVDVSLQVLNEFKEGVVQNKLYSTSWIYIPNNKADQKALIKYRDTTWVDLKTKIAEVAGKFSKEDSLLLDSTRARFDTLLIAAKGEITDVLNSFEAYNDGITGMMAGSFLEDSLIKETDRIIGMLDDLRLRKIDESVTLKNEMITGFGSLTRVLIIIAIVAVIAGLLIAFFLNGLISKPILKLTHVVDTLGKGEIPDEVDYKRDNEIGDIFTSINNLIDGINSYTFFATNVGEGKLDSQFEKLGDNDVLGTSLIDMRDNLKRVSEEERKRSWSTEGLAKFGAILRQEEDIVLLSQSIVSNLVKYIKANQAGLFVVYNNEGEDPYLELKAAFAYDRQKFLNKVIKKGQGLVGQCWHEGEYIYMTDVPDNYINIGSGLGDASPGCILIVPLVYNDDILGVIEIASFNEFSEFEIEFILKLGESIAATISTAKVNESTSKLLSETNMMTEQLQSQEEELRQQTEELLATQEESERRYIELEKKFKDLTKEKNQLEKELNEKG